MAETTRIHSTAVVASGARVDPSAHIGPFAVLGPHVSVGPRCEIQAHAVVRGHTVLGADNRVGAHAVLGGAAQVRGDESDEGRLRVGQGNSFREMVTVHCGAHGGETVIGDRNLLMVGSHVAHDCLLGSGVELANGVQLAGHVELEDGVGLGGLAAVHQFVRIGRQAFVGAGSMVAQDVPPFSLVCGDRARVLGINSEGLRRRQISAAHRRQIRHALLRLLRAPTLRAELERLRASADCTEVMQLIEFAGSSRRGLCALARPKGRGR